MTMLMKDFDTSAPVLSDEEIEAQVFRDLEAAQKALHAKEDASVILFQYPDNRTVLQRLRAWWHMRRQRPDLQEIEQVAAPEPEPDWPRHWATTKYI